jgi:opacity protein-like surface antigen
MKKLCISAVCSLAFAGFVHAQADSVADRAESHIDFASTSAAHVSLLDPAPNRDSASFPSAQFSAATQSPSLSFPELTRNATLFAPASAPASPEPAPPRPRSHEVLNWQIAIGVAYERFRSNIFNASAVGVNSTVTYFFNDWFGVDGNVSPTFAPTIFANEHVKLLNYGVGPRVAYRGGQWEPFLHVLVGGAHELPQTAGNSQNAFMFQTGGGIDYRMWPILSLRAEADYLHTSFFGTGQSNFFLSAGFVFNF